MRAARRVFFVRFCQERRTHFLKIFLKERFFAFSFAAARPILSRVCAVILRFDCCRKGADIAVSAPRYIPLCRRQ